MQFEAAVIGAGVEGSAAAYQLAEAGLKTILIEQFPLPHCRGSSHGHSRITRRAYKQTYMGELMQTAYREWDALQKLTECKVKLTTGLLYMSDKNYVDENLLPTMTSNNYSHELLNGAEVSQRYPVMRYPSDVYAVYDPDAGVLLADKAVAMLQKAFVMKGGVIRENERVEIVLAEKKLVTLATDKTRYTVKYLVIAAGAYSEKLLKPLGLHLPLQLHRVAVWYWHQQKRAHGMEQGLPCFIHDLGKNGRIYGIPSIEYKDHMKICFHDGQPISSAETRDLCPPDNSDQLRQTERYVKQHFPHLETSPSVTEYCIYTCTPDKMYIIDTHPKHRNIVVAAGFSGHGFKAAPAVGLICKQLLLREKPVVDVSPFRIDRFVSLRSAL